MRKGAEGAVRTRSVRALFKEWDVILCPAAVTPA